MSGEQTRVLGEEERIHWLRLIRTENVGPLTFHRLLARFGSAAAALQALPELARRGGRPQGVRIMSQEAAERELEAIRAVGARLIACCEPGYPPLLAHIDDAPPLICVVGDTALFSSPVVAVVGTRNASLNGRRLAASIAAELGSAGIVVVSGLARGIDTATHRAALATGTAAVVAGGVDVVYPPENGELQADIGRRGALVSEMPCGLQPRARHFPRRNRLISGISQGVVVVEAALRSGSLITARMALEQGREVFAVPGSPLDSRARGGNQLIRQGAVLTETAKDVIDALAPPAATAPRRPMAEEKPVPGPSPRPVIPGSSELTVARAAVADALSPAPATVDEIIRSCQLSPALVTAVLLEWELAGRLERQAGNRVALLT